MNSIESLRSIAWIALGDVVLGIGDLNPLYEGHSPATLDCAA